MMVSTALSFTWLPILGQTQPYANISFRVSTNISRDFPCGASTELSQLYGLLAAAIY